MDFSSLQSRPTAFGLLTLVVGWLAYLVCVSVYRLLLHPIAKFPGPKLAALSKWYEFYYEVVKKGHFTFRIQDLHRQYGPIIRITPDELHIEDSAYFDELYTKSGRLDKYDWMSGRFGNSGSVFTTAPEDLHKIRRAPLNPMFSRKKIVDFQPVIREKVTKLCQKITVFHNEDREFNFGAACQAFTGDVITEYAFANCSNHLDVPNFTETFHDSLMAASEAGHLALQFPIMHKLMDSLPESLVLKIQPLLYLLLKLQGNIKSQVQDIIEGRNEAHKHVQHPTIFNELLESETLPTSEKTLLRLTHEAQLFVAAGVATTAFTLTVAGFHIINTPEILRKLRSELESAMPEANAVPDWTKLEQLPYLTAVIKESIRLSYGVTARNPRLSPKSLKYQDWTIPPRTPVSLTVVDINHDEAIFPDSHSFKPERWLGNRKTADGSSLDRFIVSFGKGQRSCLGINLAYAELYMTLAAIFRWFSFELYETDVSDVTLAHDYLLPQVKLDSKGVRVKVKSIDH